MHSGGQTQVNVPGLSTGVAEAKATLSAADREMKRYKNHERTDIYNKAHHIIYPSGRVPRDQRTRIAIVINGDEHIVVEDRVKNCVYSKLRNKFPIEEFALMKGNDIKTKLLQVAEERYADERPEIIYEEGYERRSRVSKRTIHSRADVDWMPVNPHQPRGFADLRREDFVKIARACEYDYLFVLTMNTGNVKIESHYFPLFASHTNKEDVWLRVRLLDVNSGEYVYRNDVVVEGKSHNGGFNGRLIEKSVDQAMTEAMNDIEIEKE